MSAPPNKLAGAHRGRRRRPRYGAANAAWVLFIGSIVALAVLVALLLFTAPKPKGAAATNTPLIVYCAAGIKPPVEAVAREYEQQFGVPIQLQYGASQSLLTNAQTSKTGDLYLPADQSYIELANAKGLTAESIPLARMTVVLAVTKSNPKAIASISDLMKPDVRVAQANPDAAAVGKATREALSQTGQWDALATKTLVFKGTVNDVANDIKLGAVDAGFIWDAMLQQYPTLQRVDVPQLKDATSQVTISVLRSSKQPTAALRFARYLAAKDKGLKTFAQFGYQPVEGDLWSQTPGINLFAGAMLRPAIEQTIQRFEAREGCRVNRVYNGCGILVGEMRKAIGPMPDAYFSCDLSFMKQVQDLFLDHADISSNQLVILVPKGNPHGIKTLKDLGKPGIRLGVGHEKQCALGALTATTLDQAGLRDPVRKNVVAESATGDLLVNQLRTGSLDAVIAYISNATNSADKLEAISIDIPCAIATQPIAVSRQSQNKQIAARLMAAIESDESRQLFLANGFSWKRAAAGAK
jgi:molybdate transport system substrate-binding protein